jgi:reactive chlorine resistance protein C
MNEAISTGTAGNGLQAKSVLTKIAAFVADRNIPFLVCSIGMIVMLLWAGKFKMTAPGAEGIMPLLSHSPLTSLQLKAFGPYILGDMIGATEWTAAILLIIGYFKPKAGILGGIILVGMFFTTSSMLLTTPDDTIVVHGIHYMNNLGLFLFKDIISFGVAFYLISYYGRKAILAENQG